MLRTTYTAPSLAAIADHFLQQAEDAQQRSIHAKRATARSEAATECRVWAQAAELLKRTTIVAGEEEEEAGR